jgi:hypothetical protein
MMKLVLAGSAALMLGLGSAYAAPIRAPALGEAIDSQTTTVQMMDHHGMHRGMHRGMYHRHMMKYGMRRHHMHHRYMRHHM